MDLDTQTDGPRVSVTLREQERVNCTTVIVDDSPPSEIWRSIATARSFRRGLVDAVRQLLAEDGPTPYADRADRLVDAGLEALDGRVAEILTGLDAPRETLTPDEFANRYPNGTRAEYKRLTRHQRALELVASIGNGRTELGSLGLEVAYQVLDVIAQTDVEPELDVRLTRDWLDTRADQRRETLRLLFDTATAASIDVIATRYVRRQLYDRHRDQLPVGVREQCNPARTGTAPGTIDVDALVSAAHGELDPDGTQAAILRMLASQDGETAVYADVYSHFPGHDKSTLRQHVGQLRDLELVETYGPRNEPKHELTPAGAAYLEDVTRQVSLSESVCCPPKSIDNSRGTRASAQGGEEGTPVSGGRAADQEPVDGEAAAVTARDGHYRRSTSGYASINYLNRREEAVYRSLSPARGIALHDHPVSEQEDPREPSWGFDDQETHLTVAAEYMNPLQFTVSIARALACPRTWEQVLTPSRVDGPGGEPLGGLGITDPDLLRDLCQIGWLDSRAGNSRDDLRDAMLSGLDELLRLTRRLFRGDHDEDVVELRGEISRKALGLAGSMEMLLWLAGVDVTRVVKVPRFAQDFDPEAAESLAYSLAKQTSVASQYGGQPIERVAFEQRQSKLDRAVDVRVDGVEIFGRQLGQVLVVGQSVDDLEDPLDRLLPAPSDVREDAPEVAARIPIRTDVPRETFAELVSWALRTKGGLRPSREAVDVLRALLPSPIDALEALRWLSSEPDSRGLRLDEVRYAIVRALEDGDLDEKRLLPARSSTPRKLVATLLEASRPLQQHELVERAGVVAQSFRNHRERLQAVGLLVEVEAGWRVALPFDWQEAHRLDRGDEDLVGVAVPAFVVDERATMTDVLDHITNTLVDDPSDYRSGPVARAICWPPSLEPLLERWPWLYRWEHALRALVDAPDPPDSTVYLGVYEPQKRITAYTSNASFGKLDETGPTATARTLGDD